ncbi:transcription factor ORG2-like [Corylus avellana]|uniref:transcription factor ORG2-like n=1 Tax=Corylus avellana TaxID=13451 RepID=UPI001E21337B|nr:transcription factor ORG2-like [Corylus avellana]
MCCCALSPAPLVPSNYNGWYLLENNPITNYQSYVHGDPEISKISESLINFSTNYHPTQLQLDPARPPTAITGDSKIVSKKIFHNASERDRRKKMNGLYSTLRSLLPGADEMKKPSIPTTVSRVVKYIPELQEQVMGLIQKKEDLLSRICGEGDLETRQEKKPKSKAWSSLSTVTATQLDGGGEVVIQISTYAVHKNALLSEILVCLEDDGLVLLNASSFESIEGRVFFNLHLQVERRERLECESLSEKLISLFDKREAPQPSMIPDNFNR